MKNHKFTFKLKHDKGAFYLSAIAPTEKKAKALTLDWEYCPTCEIVARVVPVEEVKKGDYVRIKGQETVYTKQGADRSQKTYKLHAEDDISKFRYIKKGHLVEIDFEY